MRPSRWNQREVRIQARASEISAHEGGSTGRSRHGGRRHLRWFPGKPGSAADAKWPLSVEGIQDLRSHRPSRGGGEKVSATVAQEGTRENADPS